MYTQYSGGGASVDHIMGSPELQEHLAQQQQQDRVMEEALAGPSM